MSKSIILINTGLLVLLLLLSDNTNAQATDRLSFLIPKDDASTADQPTTHVWVGEKTGILFSSPFTLLYKWTNNGQIDKTDSITAEREGAVTIFVKQVAANKAQPDTFISTVVLTAIQRPPIMAKLLPEKLRKKQINFILWDTLTNTKADTGRYQIGRLLSTIYFLNRQKDSVCTLEFFEPLRKCRQYLQPGFTILLPSVGIRDLHTDLLFWTKEMVYRIPDIRGKK